MSKKYNLKGWLFLVGHGSTSGDDELWDFSDPSAPMRLPAPHVDAKAFAAELKSFYPDRHDTLGQQIIDAIQYNYESELFGVAKNHILQSIDKEFSEEHGIETNYYKRRNQLVVYGLY